MSYGKRTRSYSGRSNAAKVIQRRVRRKVSVKNKRLNPVMRKLVDRRVHMNEETGEIVSNLAGYLQVDGGVTRTDWQRLMPSIGQGDLRDARDGARIKLVSMTIKGYIHFVPPETEGVYDALMARMFIVENKDDTAYDTSAGGPCDDLSNNLLRSGSNSVTYDGTVIRHWIPTNTVWVKKHLDKSYKLISNRYQKVEGGSGTGQDVDLASTRVMKVIPFFHRLKVRNKILRYKQGETFPIGWNPLIAMGACDINNPATNLSVSHIQYIYQVTVRWKNM